MDFEVAHLSTEKRIEIAHNLGAKGAKSSETERELFEAWMAGHCWKVSGVWNGSTYIGENESPSRFDPNAMHTRQLWATWRDRAALEELIDKAQAEASKSQAGNYSDWFATQGMSAQWKEAFYKLRKSQETLEKPNSSQEQSVISVDAKELGTILDLITKITMVDRE